MHVPGEESRHPDPPVHVGDELARARERCGLSLTELSRRTKLSIRALRLIETGEMQHLAGGIYTRGALRAYAREVGAEPEDIVRRYREQFVDPNGVGDITASGRDSTLRCTCEAGQVHVPEIDAIERRRSWIAWTAGGAAILLSGTLFFGFLRRQPERPPMGQLATAAASPSLPVSGSSPPSAIGAGRSANSESPIPPEGDEPKNDLRLEVRPRGLCWLSAAADGRPAIARLTDVGQSTQIEAKERIVLRVGDAANCGLQINGAAARPLGGPGEPRTLRITRDNYRDFLNR